MYCNELLYFLILASQINKFARRKMAGINSTLYLGNKYTKITVGEIIRFFGIVLWISIEPQNMGGCLFCFVEDPIIHLCHGYYVQIRGHDVWGKYVMSLIRLKQIHSAFHHEAGISFCGDKCHQLYYFIRMANDRYVFLYW